MTIATAEILSLRDSVAPSDEAELAGFIRQAASEREPVYPIGGGTRLAYGLPASAPGLGLRTTGMNRLVDHAADDMTITVEAGTTFAQLAEILAAKRQRLPIDVPFPSQATLGGIVATNTFGPRRFGYRTIRDYLIGLRAVDGQGEPFAGGGRVVKNAAGYDISRLLIGSLGALGVVTQLSLMVRPAAETAAMVVVRLPGLDVAESLLSRLFQSQVRPVSVDVLNGGWDGASEEPSNSDDAVRLLVGFEGIRTEVEWMIASLRQDCSQQFVQELQVLDPNDTVAMWQWLVELPAQLQVNLLPSRLPGFFRAMKQIDPGCALAAYAGDGIVRIRLSKDAAGRISTLLTNQLRPAVEQMKGSLVVLSVPPGSELDAGDVWGTAVCQTPVMHAIKERFDPLGILNPGRWVFQGPLP